MRSASTRVKRALTARVVGVLPAERVGAFTGGTHTETLRANVVPTITGEQFDVLRAQLEAGDGGELRPRPKSGRTTAHAPYSSATLALNAFGG